MSPADVLAARRLIELEFVPIVAARATEGDLCEMERGAAAGEEAPSLGESEQRDLEVHDAIVVTSRTRLPCEMDAVVESARRGRSKGEARRGRRRPAHARLGRAPRHRLGSQELAAMPRATGHHIER